MQVFALKTGKSEIFSRCSGKWQKTSKLGRLFTETSRPLWMLRVPWTRLVSPTCPARQTGGYSRQGIELKRRERYGGSFANFGKRGPIRAHTIGKSRRCLLRHGSSLIHSSLTIWGNVKSKISHRKCPNGRIPLYFYRLYRSESMTLWILVDSALIQPHKLDIDGMGIN